GIRGKSDAYIARNTLTRTGGMPPMIAVRDNSAAVVNSNVIRGGGVAGVMVQGTARIANNRFEGNGPRRGPGPPNFAAWIHGGSTVTFSGNHSNRWRHALFASGAKKICVTENTARRFLGTAIVVSKSEAPAHVFGNIALSDKPNDKAVSITGPKGVVAGNERRPPQIDKPSAAPSSRP
ncbi:MAG: right-handed parallel beta-helix repeat-containing protein, partial [Planctomycetaceae bacterium]